MQLLHLNHNSFAVELHAGDVGTIGSVRRPPSLRERAKASNYFSAQDTATMGDDEDVPMETDAPLKKEEEEEVDADDAANNGGGAASGILLSGADEPEDEEEEEDADATAGTSGAGGGAAALGGAAAAAPVHNTADHPCRLISSIITPSPFARHNSSDRCRSALSRVQSAPLTDVEAWSAILTEASTSCRSLLPHLHHLTSPSLATGTVPPPSVAASSAELEAKLDWIESCHGSLLSNFPHSASCVVSMAEMLLGQTALPGEEGLVGMPSLPANFPPPHEGVLTERQKRCQDKLERIFTVGLGVADLDGTGKGDGIAAGASAAGSGGSGAAGGKDNNDDDVDDDGVDPFAKSTTDLIGGILSPSAELWLLHVKCVTRRATRTANVAHPPSAGGASASARAECIRDRTTTAYETALARGGAFCLNNHLVWSGHLTFVKGWEGQATTSAPDGSITTDHALLQKRLSHLRRLYQRLVGHPMTGLDMHWTEYENYEKNQGGAGAEQLAAALIAEHQPRYQHARSVYLERNRICDLRNAQTSLGVGRLAVPPVEPPRRRGKGGVGGMADADGGKVAGLAGAVPKKGGAGEDGTGGAAGAGGAADDDDAADKMAQHETNLEEELTLLSRWTTRVSYERTNPERLAAGDLTRRVRSIYKEFVSCFARHPETWDGWSAWEFLHSASSDSASSGGGSRKLAGKVLRRRAAMADAVLQLGMTNVPTSALLVIQRAEILEQCGSSSGKSLDDGSSKDRAGAEAAIELLSTYAKEHPTTLVFVCLQKMVRKYKGISAARAVFSRARKELKMRPEDCAEDLMAVAADADGDAVGSSANVVSETENGDKTADNGGAKKAAMSLAGSTGTSEGRMVTTRLAPSVGVGSVASLIGSGDGNAPEDATTAVVHRGVITHHLYSSHADIERYLNSSPHVAARVYELGLRRHRTFLTVPSYVLAYANLLLELGDWSNLRGLLARSVGACEEDLANTDGGGTAVRDADKSKTSDSADSKASASKARREASRPLWDAYLRIESLISSVSGSGDVDSVRNVEARRRRALYGPTSSTSRAADDDQAEDVAGGAYSVVEGNQHSNLADTLVRTDGYDASSRISNGLGRLVDSLEVCGLMGGGLGSSGANALLGSGGSTASILSESTSAVAGSIASDSLAGGPADAGIKRRLSHVQRREAMAALASMTGGAMLGTAGLTVVGVGAGVVGGAAGRARDRLMQQQAATAQANAAATIAPGSPEWLRSLILYLPRLPAHRVGQRPPPHLIEMALASLQSNDLPADRPVDPVPTVDATVPGVSPIDASAPSDPRKRKRGLSGGGGGGDSSDEENGGGASGYGSQFRARQRQRMMSGQ